MAVGGDPWSGAGPVLETWGWTEAICRVSGGVHGEKEGEKERGGVRSELLDIPLCASAAKGIREPYK